MFNSGHFGVCTLSWGRTPKSYVDPKVTLLERILQLHLLVGSEVCMDRKKEPVNAISSYLGDVFGTKISTSSTPTDGGTLFR